MRIKHFITCLLMLGAWESAWTNTNGVEFDLLGGASFWVANGGITNKTGITGGLEVAYVGRKSLSRTMELGVKTGISFGMATATHQLLDYTEHYTNEDYYPENIDYTIRAATYRQHQSQWHLMIPVFLSLKTHGIIVNIGAKASYILSQKRQLDVTNAHIMVYYPELDVPVQDYLATGRLEGFGDHQLGRSTMPTWSVLLSGEIGYEWRMNKHSRLGMALFADYTLWNNYSNIPANRRLIDVAPIMNKTYPVPDIKVNYLTDTYSDKVKYMSVGIKVFFVLSPYIEPCRCINN